MEAVWKAIELTGETQTRGVHLFLQVKANNFPDLLPKNANVNDGMAWLMIDEINEIIAKLTSGAC